MGIVKQMPTGTPTTNTLASLPNPGAHALQIPAIDAAWVRFNGTSGDVIDNPPEIDEERTYIVKAVCSGYALDKREDNENRVVAKMKIISCFERGRVPIVDENQGSLFPDPSEGESGIDLPDDEEDAEDPADDEGEGNDYSPFSDGSPK